MRGKPADSNTHGQIVASPTIPANSSGHKCTAEGHKGEMVYVINGQSCPYCDRVIVPAETGRKKSS